MTEDIKPEVIKRTQDSLKKFIRKPPLTEKLLKKPPFRFLHDLTTSIMKETGYLQGLYSSEELNADNIKDRDGKIAFLEKLIAAVKLSTGANVSARPTKIVAGLEVEKTNELLQIIGRALEKKIDSSKAVEQIVNKGSKKTSNSKTKEVSKSKASKDAIIEESKTKDKNEVKRKKPSTRQRDEVTKESTSNVKLKQSSKKENSTPTRAKEKSPTKSVSDRAIKSKNLSRSNSDSNKNETFGENVQQTESENKAEPVKPDETSLNKEKPVLQKRSSVEKPVLQKKPSREKIPLIETSVDITDDEFELKENEIPPDKVEAMVPIIEQKEDNYSNEKLVENEELEVKKVEKDAQEKEKEVKEETHKMKRPSSAHHGHRRNSSARRTSDVENSVDSKAVSQAAAATVTADSVANASATNTNVPEDVQVLGVLNSNSSEPVVKVSSPVVSRPRTAARPPSARPGAPRVRDRGHVEVVEDVRSPSVPVNVIVDAEGTKDEDDENLVVLEAQPAPSEEQMDQPKPEFSSSLAPDLGLDGKEQGRLVAQILETQRELELSGGLSSKVEIEWEGGRKRERETALKEVDRLRGAIQSLTRAANPLGKLIDFLQEDVDSMQRELIQWQQMNSQLAKELQSEESLTETSLEPLNIQLDELDQLIQDELEKVSAVKASIVRNDERILKLLPGVHHS